MAEAEGETDAQDLQLSSQHSERDALSPCVGSSLSICNIMVTCTRCALGSLPYVYNELKSRVAHNSAR